MDLMIVDGEIESWGEARKPDAAIAANFPWTYKFVVFNRRDGQPLHVKNLVVTDELTRGVVANKPGLFALYKPGPTGSRELVAVRFANGWEAFSTQTLNPGTAQRFGALMVILAGIPLSFVLIGIPLVYLGIKLLFGGGARAVKQELRAHGFQLIEPERI